MLLISACAIAALFYAVNLYRLVSNSIALRQIESRSVALTSSLGDMNARYLKIMSAITPDAVGKQGLVPAQVSLYITRPSATASIGNLAQRGHEL